MHLIKLTRVPCKTNISVNADMISFYYESDHSHMHKGTTLIHIGNTYIYVTETVKELDMKLC